MTIRPYEAVARAAPLWRDDPNYPGVPAETTPAEMVAAKTTHRATVDYDTYVLRYSARQRGHVLMIFAGITLAIGAIMLIQHETALILALTAALGLIGGGGAGFLIAAAAHGTYTRDLAVSVSETYHPRRAPQPETVRPFVPSSDGNGRTTNTGRLSFSPHVWRSLFDRALANGGVITRDGAKDSRVGRDWYHGQGWGAFLEELTRLGFIDARNRLTPAALAWYEQQIPLPLAAFPSRSRPERTNGANERTNGAHNGEGRGS